MRFRIPSKHKRGSIVKTLIFLKVKGNKRATRSRIFCLFLFFTPPLLFQGKEPLIEGQNRGRSPMIKRDKHNYLGKWEWRKGLGTSIKAKPQEIHSEETEACICFPLIGQDLYRFQQNSVGFFWGFLKVIFLSYYISWRGELKTHGPEHLVLEELV